MLASGSASAQLTYYVNARTGMAGNNGLSPTAAFPSVRAAFASMVPAASGTFHTLYCAGTFVPGTEAVIEHDDSIENWSTFQSLLVPRSIQVLYDATNSDKSPGSVRAPVVFNGLGVNVPLFRFSATKSEPSSRFDGANPLDPSTGYANAWIRFRNAGLAVQIRPPATLVSLPSAIPPGAAFRRVRWESCSTGIQVDANLFAAGAAASFPFTLNPSVEECHFTTSSGVIGSAHIEVLSYEGAGGALTPYNPSPSLTVLDSLLELGPGGLNVGTGFAQGVYLFSRGLFHAAATGAAGNVGGSSSSIQCRIERTEICGLGGAASPRQRGVYGNAQFFQGTINLTMKSCELHDLGSTGVLFVKTHEGIGQLSISSSTIARTGENFEGTDIDESGIAIEVEHNPAANGYNAASTLGGFRKSCG